MVETYVSADLGRAPCGIFLRAVLLEKARALEGPASRVLVNAATHAAKRRPEVMVESLLLPLLCGEARVSKLHDISRRPTTSHDIPRHFTAQI